MQRPGSVPPTPAHQAQRSSHTAPVQPGHLGSACLLRLQGRGEQAWPCGRSAVGFRGTLLQRQGAEGSRGRGAPGNTARCWEPRRFGRPSLSPVCREPGGGGCSRVLVPSGSGRRRPRAIQATGARRGGRSLQRRRPAQGDSLLTGKRECANGGLAAVSLGHTERLLTRVPSVGAFRSGAGTAAPHGLQGTHADRPASGSGRCGRRCGGTDGWHGPVRLS